MPADHFHIQTPRTARIAFEGNERTATTCNILLHGYGQLAGEFLSTFSPLFSNEIYWIAPEGLSKFYLKSISGQIGASWMTKEDRLAEIKDYTNYLDTVYAHIQKFSFKTINIIAFSQGVPTACRWISESTPSFNRLILHSSIFPKDMALAHFKNNFKSEFELHFVYGTKDKLLGQEQLDEIQVIGNEFPNITIHPFDGRHEIHLPIIEKITGA